jgi:metal-sulfur cluster biosynthetic enzyme
MTERDGDVGARLASPSSGDQPGAALKEEDVYEVLHEVYDPEIPVNIVDLGLVYEISIAPARVDVKMTLTAMGCPMAAEVMADVRDHLLTLPGVEDAGVELVYEPPWSPERMTEDARWELGLV